MSQAVSSVVEKFIYFAEDGGSSTANFTKEEVFIFEHAKDAIEELMQKVRTKRALNVTFVTNFVCF